MKKNECKQAITKPFGRYGMSWHLLLALKPCIEIWNIAALFCQNSVVFLTWSLCCGVFIFCFPLVSTTEHNSIKSFERVFQSSASNLDCWQYTTVGWD